MRAFTAITIGLALLAADPSGAEQDFLRVTSYNIHHGQRLDGNLKQIADVVSETNPDLVTLQEIDFKTRRSGRVDQASILGELCEMHAVFDRATDYQGGQYSNAVLSVKSIVATNDHRLPRAGGKENRFAVAATVQLHRRQHIVLACTHFDQRGGRAREEASRTSLALVRQSGVVVMLAGDLNCEPNAPELHPLSSVFSSVKQEPVNTSPVKAPAKQVDYILFGKRARWHVESVEAIDDDGAFDNRSLLDVLRVRG